VAASFILVREYEPDLERCVKALRRLLDAPTTQNERHPVPVKFEGGALGPEDNPAHDIVTRCAPRRKARGRHANP
jgi:hypothetical protein